MDVQASDGLWPPRIGDYARVRRSGVLSEVLDVECSQSGARYTVNVLAPGADAVSEYRLDDLLPVWPLTWTRPPIQ